MNVSEQRCNFSLSLSVFSYATVYRDLERTITSASAQDDLKWFSNNHGPGMHMNWPQFEVHNHFFPVSLTMHVFN